MPGGAKEGADGVVADDKTPDVGKEGADGEETDDKMPNDVKGGAGGTAVDDKMADGVKERENVDGLVDDVAQEIDCCTQPEDEGLHSTQMEDATATQLFGVVENAGSDQERRRLGAKSAVPESDCPGLAD
eukprot:5340472-Pyramimonas_sp.AAC.1